MRINVLGMDNCFEAARLCGVNRVVYASSLAVSGLQSHFGDRTINENDPKRGTNQYATHKIFNEFQAQMYTERINVLGMDNCFEAARLCGVNRVVYASSLAVSGLQSHFGDRTINENDPKRGTNQYATHKIFNEFQAQMYTDNYGMSITGIRPANVIGPDKVRGSTDHVQCVVLPARGEPVVLPFKSRMRTPIYVEDIAEASVRVSMAGSTRYPIYNSGGTPISLGDLADMVRGYIPDAQISFEDEGGFEESGNYLIDNSRLLAEFELRYQPFPASVLEIINEVRRQEGLPLVEPR